MNTLRVLLALTLAVAISGCASGATPGGSADGGATATPSASRGETTIAGRLGTESVEGGCVSLETEDGETYQLSGTAIEALEPGAVVILQGSVDAEMASVCMVGPIFRVSEVLEVVRPSDGDEPGGSGAAVTLTGRLGSDTVEGGCTYLETDRDTRHELIYRRGVDRPSPPATVSVRGEFRDDMVSTCMIGRIFLVSEVISVED